MPYKPYKTKVQPLSPVAIKLGQTEVHASDNSDWGIVSCGHCDAPFAIGPNRIHGSQRKDTECAKDLEAILAEDHARNRPHSNSYNLVG